SVLSIYSLLLSAKSPAQVIFEHNADFAELSKYIKFDENNIHIIEGAGVDRFRFREGADKQVISSQADSLIKISRIWADFFPANTSNQPI
ncbi:hypothetical protein, partial [Acinetobacter baumannii]